MTGYPLAVAQLLIGSACGIAGGILLPGYAMFLLCREAAGRMERRPRFRSLALADCFPYRGLDALTGSALCGIVYAAAIATILSRNGWNLAEVGFPVFIALDAIALVAAVVILCRIPRPVNAALVASAAKKSGKGSPQEKRSRTRSKHLDLVSAPRPDQTPACWRPGPVERVVFICLIAAVLVELGLRFFGSPIVWDVPTLWQIQMSYWGDYPSYQMRGGWMYPGLIMASGVFEPARFPLLNAGIAPGWLSCGLLFLALVYLIPAGERLTWIGSATALLIGSRFLDFVLNVKFSVLGVALCALFLGLVRRYLDTREARYVFLSSLCLAVGFGCGLVGPFYAGVALVFLLLFFPIRMIPVIAAGSVFCGVLAFGGLHWAVAVALIPAGFAAAALVASVVCSLPIIRSSSQIPSRGALVVLPVLISAAASLVLAAFHPNSAYWWYSGGRLPQIYVRGYGAFGLLAVGYLVYVCTRRKMRRADVLPVAMCFTTVTVPAVVIACAGVVPLPAAVPPIIFYEIGRVTALYFVPFTICVSGGAMLSKVYCYLARRSAALGYGMLAVVAGALFVPSPLFSYSNLGGWERVGWISGAEVFSEAIEQDRQASVLAKQAGNDGEFTPLFFGFGPEQLEMSRALAGFGGPSNRCLYYLGREEGPRNDFPAATFFSWHIQYHLFPYLKPVRGGQPIPDDPSCDGKRTVLVHRSDYDLATELPRSVGLRRQLSAYRIYSERP